MFAQRSRVRHLAAFMLLVWLFALTSGVVNACVVEPDLRHVALLATQERHERDQALPHGHDRQSEPATGVSLHEHQAPDASLPPCAKFCDDETASTPTGRVQAEPTDPLHWLALITVLPGPMAVQAQAVSTLTPDARVPHLQGSILYTFLHLAL